MLKVPMAAVQFAAVEALFRIAALMLAVKSVSALEIHYPQWRLDLSQRRSTSIDTSTRFATVKPYSLSQSEEDQHLYQHYFCGVRNGTFLELGALDGRRYSNSHLFEYGLGWRGVLIEGNPRSFERLKVNRPNTIRINAAVCDTYRSVRYAVNGEPAVNGILDFMSDMFKQEWHPNWKNYNDTEAPIVPCYPMEALLRSAGLRHYHFMSLDVEGAELMVLKSMDFDGVTFNVIVVETEGHGPEHATQLREILQKSGYRHVETWNRSDWFVRNGWEPLPCN